MRKCGSCYVCCYYVKVGDKPANTLCPHLAMHKRKKRCKLFGNEKRPSVCNSFLCSWMRGFGQAEERPNQCGVLVSISELNNGVWIFVKELEENAVKTTGKSIIMSVAKQVDLPVIVIEAGTNPPGDTGDYTIVKAGIRHRATKMTGDLLGYLDDAGEYGIYELIGGGA